MEIIILEEINALRGKSFPHTLYVFIFAKVVRNMSLD